VSTIPFRTAREIRDAVHSRNVSAVQVCEHALATIDAAGSFSAAAPLMNTIEAGDLLLVGDASVGIGKCGPVAASIARWRASGRSLRPLPRSSRKTGAPFTPKDLHNESKILGSLSKSS
jgi:Asp-tRNA(Asn)/Glu-tRNA(Gln) amidotransferase A subunit family amidase